MVEDFKCWRGAEDSMTRYYTERKWEGEGRWNGQVIELLPSKHKALSSNPSIAGGREGGRKWEGEYGCVGLEEGFVKT
jgi:hypothetical protein